jgi:hypothetical protein
MRFFRRLTTEHIGDIVRRFSGYSHEILQSEYSSGSDSSTRVFHDFMIDTPIFKEYHQWIMTGRPELLKYVISFLTFGKKLDYEDAEFNATAFRGWLEVEESLRTLTFSDNDCRSLANIIQEIIPRYPRLPLLPRFGTGKVAERGILDVYDKFTSLSTHPRLEYAFGRERPHCSRDEGYGPDWYIPSRRVSVDVSRLKFVPKDLTKSRSICMEPNAFMYYQQEVHRNMREAIVNGKISRFIKLEDQTFNQDAALHSSKYLSSDTLDLSSASDSVHIDLVRRIFPKDYLFYMLATRTSLVETEAGKDPVRVMKFAPMGSAVCFPTQCIIFTAVCLYAYWCVNQGISTGDSVCERADIVAFMDDALHARRSASTPFTRKYEPPVVYGDDIIVDSRTTAMVISTLTRLGFSVNRSKSFTGSQSVRESCGIYAYEGSDITPVLFRLKAFARGKIGSQEYASLIGSINNFRDHGYHQVATFLDALCRDLGFKVPIPYTTDKRMFGIYTLNKHAVPEEFLRWNADWQVHEELSMGICLKQKRAKPPKGLDSYRLNIWWRSRVRDFSAAPDKGVGLRIRPEETGIAPRWTRCEL